MSLLAFGESLGRLSSLGTFLVGLWMRHTFWQLRWHPLTPRTSQDEGNGVVDALSRHQV